MGFETRALFRNHFTKWSEVKEFAVTYIGSKKMVGYSFSDMHEKKKLEELSVNLTGYDAALPDTYGQSPEELATALNEWKNRYSEWNKKPLPI